ncbi:C4-dicarboxylic acid transporter DauA [Candidatus Electronema sp. TJ]|uniref:C4-dicarboxylic acid transporter DauA n=1 Tax=Candidatus Electronema sp. TJ TaxID=3401573 RepID=UPI003AA93142
MFSAFTQTVKAKPSLAAVQADVLSGLIVGIVALPLSMAFAIASGVAPQHGLYTAIVAGIVISLSGGSVINVSGPTAAFTVVLLPIVQKFGVGGLLVSGAMAGIIMIIMGAAKLGSLIEVVPYPVTVGFTSGIAVIIATFQIKDFFGLNVEPVDGHYLEQVGAIMRAVPTATLADFLIGMLTLTVLLVWPRLRSKVPGHLIAVLAGSVAAWAGSKISPDFVAATIGSRFHYEVNGVNGGGIPPFLPSLNWPWNLPGADGTPVGLSWKMLHDLFPSAIAIAVLGAITSLLCSVIADGLSGCKHDSNDELIGQGIGNIVAPFFGGIPATAAIARTATNIKAGGRTPLAAIVHSLFVLLAILLITPLLSYIPMASMAALLFIVAWNMSEVKHFIRTIRIAPRSDVAVLLICLSLTVFFDMAIAVGVGMSLAAILFIQNTISLTTTKKMEREHHGLGELSASVAVYDINGPLFFGSAQKAMKNIAAVSPDVRVVILEMSKVNIIDMSAMVAMESISQTLERNGIGLVVSGLQPRMLLTLRRAGLRRKTGKVEFSRTLADGVEKAKRLLRSLREHQAP